MRAQSPTVARGRDRRAPAVRTDGADPLETAPRSRPLRVRPVLGVDARCPAARQKYGSGSGQIACCRTVGAGGQGETGVFEVRSPTCAPGMRLARLRPSAPGSQSALPRPEGARDGVAYRHLSHGTAKLSSAARGPKNNRRADAARASLGRRGRASGTPGQQKARVAPLGRRRVGAAPQRHGGRRGHPGRPSRSRRPLARCGGARARLGHGVAAA